MPVVPTLVGDLDSFRANLSGIVNANDVDRGIKTAEMVKQLFHIGDNGKVWRTELKISNEGDLGVNHAHDQKVKEVEEFYADLKSGKLKLSEKDAAKLVGTIAKAAADGNVTKDELRDDILKSANDIKSKSADSASFPDKNSVQKDIAAIKPYEVMSGNGLKNRIATQTPF